MKYTEKYKTKWYETDASRRLRPSELVVYMQETANLQFESVGRSLDIERDTKGVGFILSKMSIDIIKPIFAYENIEVETFTAEGRSFAFHRCFRVLRNGEVVAKAASVWALVNVNDGKLIRCEDTDLHFEHEEMLVTDMPLRIKMPRGAEFESCGKRKIVYSDIDYNMHMNNARYPNMLCDYIDLCDVARIKGISLSFLHESPFGNEIEILRLKTEDGYFFRTLSQDGTVCLEAQIRCED